MSKYLCFFALTFLPLISFNQDTKDIWDVNNPPADWQYDDVSFMTNEGTWMNVDVSPDGQLIGFDMVGDIYTMPITGGKAKCIRSGQVFEVYYDLVQMDRKFLFQVMPVVEIIFG